jgi:hypothetical protein
MNKFANIESEGKIVQVSEQDDIFQILIQNSNPERIPEILIPMHKDTFVLLYTTMNYFIQNHSVDILPTLSSLPTTKISSNSDNEIKEINFPDFVLEFQIEQHGKNEM